LSALTPTSARWVPSADTSACDASLRSQEGPSMAQIQPDDSHGVVALYTAAVPDSGFLRPYDDAGQDGSGTNAHITGTLVTFRQAWWNADPIQPWLASQGSGTARVVTTQSVAATATDDAIGSPGFTQVKQQVSVSF